MTLRKAVLLIAAVSMLEGCGTWLAVRDVGIDDPSPGGVAVNQRGNYDVSGTLAGAKIVGSPLVAVAPERLTVVNWKRLPFSSGDLTVKLTTEQTLKEVTLSGTTGAARAAEAAGAALDAAAAIEKARAEQK